MSDCVDTVMNAVQPPRGDTSRYGLVRKPEPLFQLTNRHYAMLPCRQSSQAQIPLSPLRSIYGPASRARSSLGPASGP